MALGESGDGVFRLYLSHVVRKHAGGSVIGFGNDCCGFLKDQTIRDDH